MFLILLFKLLTQFPFVSFVSISILSLLPFSILSLLPLHHPFFLFWSILCPQTSIYYILFANGTYFCILFHTMTLSFFLIMHSISLKKPNFYGWAPTCHTLRTWRNNGSLSQSSLFSLSSFPLASLPSLLALLINSLSSQDKHFMFHSVSLLSQAPLARGSHALPRVLLLWINRKNWRFFMGARNWLPLWNNGQKSDGRLHIWCSIQQSLFLKSG